MGCNCSKSNEQTSLDRPRQKTIKLYGNYINSDTLSILAILSKFDINYKFINAFEFSEKHYEDDGKQRSIVINQQYKKLFVKSENPLTLDIPIIIDKGLNIYSKNFMPIIYLINSNQLLSKALIPKNEEQIDSYLVKLTKYSQSQLRKKLMQIQDQYLRRLLSSSYDQQSTMADLQTRATNNFNLETGTYNNDNEFSQNNEANIEDLKVYLSELQDSDLLTLPQKQNEDDIFNINENYTNFSNQDTLQQTSISTISVLDIVIYLDLHVCMQILKNENMIEKFSRLNKWYIQVGKDKEINQMKQNFKNYYRLVNLYQP